MANIGLITLSPSAITLTSAEHIANQKWFDFTTTQIIASSLNVICDSSWLTPDIDYYEDNAGEIWFQVPKNTTTESRTAQITLVGRTAGTGVAVTASAKITQPAGEEEAYTAYFELDNSATTIDSRSQSATIGYKAQNIGQITVYTESDWLTAEYNSSKEIRFVATQNNTSSSRTATIRITAYDNLDYVGRHMTAMVDYTVTQKTYEGNVYFEPSVLTLAYNDTASTVDVTYSSAITFSSVSVDLSWIAITSTTDIANGKRITLSSTENTTQNNRIARLRVDYSYTSTGGTRPAPRPYYSMMEITQFASPKIEEFPIWRDKDITFNTDNAYVSYKIVSGENVIYSGRAYTFDGVATVRVNNVISEYLNDYINFDENGVVNNNTYMQFDMIVSYDDWDTSQLFCYLRTYDDWSYEDSLESIISRPVRNMVDSRQYFLMSCFNSKAHFAEKLVINNLPFVFNNEVGTLVVPVEKLVQNNSVCVKDSSGKTLYNFNVDCSKGYVLYFKNKFGGWDWLNCDGKILKQNSFAISTLTKNINNNTINRNTVQYKKVITEKWQLGSGILTDKQAERVADMMRSTKVYLHILDESKIVPVNITNTSVDYKTYRNNSRKMVTYTINVENAQTKQIR